MKKILILSLLGTIMLTADSAKNTLTMPVGTTELMMNNPIKVRYTNYRGETGVRTIVPLSFSFGHNEWHKEDQWLLTVWDIERNAERVYALKEITEWFVK